MDRRIDNIKKQQVKGAECNKIKGCLAFIKSKRNKSDIYFNELIDELINTGYYDDIYNKYILQDIDVDDIPIKDFNILELLDFVDPIDLKTKYKGLTIRSVDI
jgi:hypothetical protein